MEVSLKINNIHIKNFGHFRNYPLQLGNKNLTIIYGENEAGKSTLTHFFKNLVLGMPIEHKYQYYLSGSQKGGHCEGSLDDGTPFKLESYKRKQRLRPSLIASNAKLQAAAENTFNSIIKTIGDQVYQNLFACTIKDFHNTSNFLRERDFKEFLSQFLIGGQNPKSLIKSLNSQAEEYFTSVKGKKKLKKIKESIGSLKVQVSSKELRSSEYYEKKEAFEAAEVNCRKISDSINAKRQRHQLLKIYMEWLEENQHKELASLAIARVNPPNSFPPAGLSRLQEQLSSLAQKEVLITNLKAENKELENKAKSQVFDQRILDQADQVKYLEVNAKELERLLEQQPELLATFDELNIELQTQLANLGHAWSQEDLVSLQISHIQKAKLDKLASTSHELDEKASSIESSLQSLKMKQNSIENQKSAFNSKILPKIQLREAEEFFNNQILDLIPKQEELISSCDEIHSNIEALARDLSYEETHFASIENIIGSKYPDLSLIEDFSKRHNDLCDKQKLLHSEIEKQTERASTLQRSIKLKRSEAGIASLDLKHLRNRKDQGWELLKEKIAKLEEGNIPQCSIENTFLEGHPNLESAFEDTLSKIDFLTDKIIDNHELVAMEKEFDEVSLLNKEKQAKLEVHLAEERQLLEEWEALWNHLPLTPLQPRFMLTWRQSLSDLRSLYAKFQSTAELRDRTAKALQTWLDDVKKYLSTGADINAAKDAYRVFLSEQNRQHTLIENLDLEHLEIQAIKSQKMQELSLLQKEKQGLLSDWETCFTSCFKGKKAIEIDDWKLFIATIDLSLNALKSYKQHQNKIALAKTELNSLRKKVKDLCTHLDLKFHDTAVMISLNHILDEYEKNAAKQRTLDALNIQLKHIKDKLRQQEGEAIRIKEQIDALLSESGCKDEHMFLKAGKAHEEALPHQEALKAAMHSLQVLEAKLERLGGLNDEFSSLTLDDRGFPWVEQELLREGSEVAQLELELKGAYEDLAKKKMQFNSLDGSDDVAFYQSEITSKESEFKDSLLDYLSLKLGAKVLNSALESFENQTHPQFIKLASNYLNQITSGKYCEINEDNDDYYIERSEAEPLSINQLSTGTAEQLYLSMRLAAMEQLASKGETLPFILDDILANSDYKRASKAMRAISQLSHKTQIIYLTCHPSFIEMAKSCLNFGSYDIVHLKQLH